MTHSREQFLKTQNPPPRTVKERQRTFRAVQQAAANADLLTGDPKWDTFLSYLEATVNAATTARDRYIVDIASPLLVDTDQLRLKQVAIIRLNERIATLQGVMNIPVDLKNGSDAAGKELEKLGKLEEKEIAA